MMGWACSTGLQVTWGCSLLLTFLCSSTDTLWFTWSDVQTGKKRSCNTPLKTREARAKVTYNNDFMSLLPSKSLAAVLLPSGESSGLEIKKKICVWLFFLLFIISSFLLLHRRWLISPSVLGGDNSTAQPPAVSGMTLHFARRNLPGCRMCSPCATSILCLS